MPKSPEVGFPGLSPAKAIINNPSAYTGHAQLRLDAYATLVEARGGVFRSENIPQMMPAETKPDPERSELTRAIERAQPAIRAAAARVRGFGGDAA
ncbi:hypothetical protein KO491_11350 [Roseovarius nubinhibens]|uniref:hypothetical protein n=1 Tax=Roseovarius nubinhibens TaxID=314263 RepID=UPI001C08D75B|nr:hypothetical protein [Roseovarius nubinhibens]MBU3000430.1 hypothetical protein [Roseovarius nubinhibens]